MIKPDKDTYEFLNRLKHPPQSQSPSSPKDHFQLIRQCDPNTWQWKYSGIKDFRRIPAAASDPEESLKELRELVYGTSVHYCQGLVTCQFCLKWTKHNLEVNLRSLFCCKVNRWLIKG